MAGDLENKVLELERKLKILEAQNTRLSERLTRIRNIYENTTIGLYQTNPEGEILAINQPLMKMMGFNNLQEIQENNLNNDQLISKIDRKAFMEKIDNDGQIIGHETAWIKKDGSTMFVRESSRAIKDKNGKTLYYEGTVEDITDQKIKTDALFESENKYRRLVELLPFGVIIHKNGIVEYANDQAGNIMQVSKKIVFKGKNIFNYLHPSYHKTTIERLKRSLSDFSLANTSEQIYITSTGKEIFVDATTIPFKSGDETLFVTIFSDISDRKQSEKELKLSEITYRGILNNISDAIFIQDQHGSMIDVNKTTENMFGYENNYFIGKKPIDFSSENKNDFVEVEQKLSNAFNGKRESLKFWAKKSDGSDFRCEASLASGMYYDKKVVISVVRDISEQEEKERIILESQKKYKNLIDFAVGGILMGNQEGFIIDANSHMCSIFGRKRTEILGKHLNDGFFTKQSIKDKPLRFSDLKKGKPIISQREVLRPDGTILHVEMHSKILPNGTYQTIYHDISDRLRAEEETLKSKERAETLHKHKEALLRAIPDMLFTFKSDGTIVDFYSNSKHGLLASPSFFLNKNIHEILPSELAKTTEFYIKKILKTKRMNKYVYMLKINNEILHFDARMVYLSEDTTMAVVRDITDRMELIEDLEIAKKRAEENDKLKSAFLSNLSHEIRTPMNGILGFTDLLKDDISSEEKIDYIGIIENSCNQLLMILDDIIEISKIEAGIINKNLSNYEVHDFIKNLHDQMKGLVPKNKDIELKVSKTLTSKKINGVTDIIKLKQVLSNLISNAFKFTEKGYVEIGFEIISDTYIKFFIKDTGVGITKADIKKIFHRFVQIDNKFSSINSGSGLGLSISKAYVELLNGRIYADSKIGEGSTFYVTIPMVSYS